MLAWKESVHTFYFNNIRVELQVKSQTKNMIHPKINAGNINFYMYVFTLSQFEIFFKTNEPH